MTVSMIPLDNIVEDTEQPRRYIDPESLKGLSESIKQYGVLQPITVRELKDENCYQIITGERRWRASQMAGLDEIPCIIKDVDDDEILTEQLIENIQREDLQPLDKAKALLTIKEKRSLNNRELAKTVGLTERAVGNLLGILNLPEEVGEKIVATPNRPSDGQLTEKHGRFLKMLNDDVELQSRVVDAIERNKLTGDETGRLVGALKRHPDQIDDILDEPYKYAAVEMQNNNASGPAIKVLDITRYLQGLELLRLSNKQLGELEVSMQELKATIDILKDEISRLRSTAN